MRRAAALLLALLAASPAAAVNRYVSTSGSATWANATNPATPASLATALSSAVAGDVIHMSSGSYSGSLDPANGVVGTAGSRIVFMGPAGDTTASGVVINGDLKLNSNDYITVKWMRFTGSVDVSTHPAIYPANDSNADSVHNVRALGGLDFSGSRDLVVTNSTFGLGNTASGSFYCNRVMGNGTDPKAMRTVVRDCQFYIGGTGGAVPNKINWCFNAEFERVRVFLFAGSSLTVGSEWNRACNIRITDSRWEMLNASGSADCYLFYLRDSCSFNTFVRDTFWINPASAQPGRMLFSGSGAARGPVYQYANTYTSCVFRKNSTSTDYQSFWRRNVFSGCIFIGDGVAPFAPSDNSCETSEFADSVTLSHNTYYRIGSGVVADNLDAEFTNSTISHNIFAASVAGAPALAEWTIATSGNTVNNNLYWSGTAGDSASAVLSLKNCATTGNGKAGPSGTPCTTNGIECNSRFGNPGFADAANYDFTPVAGGNAFGSWWPDGYVGAISTGADTSGGGDVDPPGTVTDLEVSDTGPTSAILGWTAAGDDGFSGISDTMLVRRSASAINSESAWTNATVVTTLGGGGQSPGNEQQNWFDSGLTAGSTVFYAVRYRDDAGNFGGISNSPSVTLPGAPDVTAPSVISSLTAIALTPYSIRLQWTAPGNDGATGIAANYRIKRRAGTTFVLGDSAAATVVTPPAPQVAGTVQTVDVGGLSPSTAYAFAMWTADAAGNTATISNAATATTEGVPSVPVAAASNRRRRR